MNLTLILSLLLILISVILVFKFVKNVLRALVIIFLFVLVFSAGLGFYVYSDFVELKNNFIDSDKKIFLSSPDDLVAGFIMADNIQFFNSNEIAALNNYYRDNDFDSLRGNAYKVFLIDYEYFSELDYTINLGDSLGNDRDIILNKTEILQLLNSKDPFNQLVSNHDITNSDKFADIIKEQLQGKLVNATPETMNSINIKDSGTLKSLLFAYTLSQSIFENKNPFYFFVLYRDGKIKIYPETIVFKVIKFLPSSMFDKIVTKAAEI